MQTKNAILSIVLLSVLSPPSHAFTYVGESKWDDGMSPYSASLHGFSAPNGPQTPGRGTWSIMPGGLEVHPSASLIDPDHSSLLDTVAISELGVPGFTVPDYEIMINQAIDTWASVSKFTNVGQVDDGEGHAGSSGAMGDTGVLRFAAWRLTNGALAHAFAPGTEASPAGGNNIFGDIHIDPTRNWIDNGEDLARGNDPYDEVGPNGAATFDLFTVILHEAGHALGLGHSTVEGSVMEEFYEGGRRVLSDDDKKGIQALYGAPGTTHFSVAAGAEGIAPGKVPNDVFTFGPASPGPPKPPTTAVVFVSPMNSTNSVATSPPMLGLVPLDNIDGLSNATSGSHGGGSPVLLFSVDTASVGKPGTAVHYEAVVSPPTAPHAGPVPANPGGGDPGNESASDIYASTALTSGHFGYYPGPTTQTVAYFGKNTLYADEVQLGLQAPAMNGAALGGPEDNLDGMELDGNGSYFSLSIGSPTAASPALTVYDGGGVPVAYPFIIHMPGETRTAEDILLGGSAAIYAPGHSLGLVLGDDVDALVVSDVIFEQFPPPGMVVFAPNSFLDPGIDTALFSLAPGSPSLIAGGFSPADVFKTTFGGSFSLYASADSLGLLASDNIDALDIRNGELPPPVGGLVPEPGTQLLVLLGLLQFAFIGRRHSRS